MPLIPKDGSTIGLTDTWPFRLLDAAGAAIGDMTTLPGDVYTGKQSLDDPSLTPRVLNFGSLAAPMNPAVRSGGRAIPGEAFGRSGPPSREALGKAADADIATFRQSGIKMGGETVASYATALRKGLNQEGFLDTDAPSTFKVLSILENPKAGATLSAQGFHSARKALQRVAGNYSPNKSEDRAAANVAIRALDNLFARLPDEAFVDSTPAQIAAARKAFGEFRGNYAAAKRSDTVTGVEDAAELRAAAANSGQNIDNALRQRLTAILLDPKKQRGFSKEELDLMRRAVEGTRTKNFARHASNVLGGGQGLGALGATAAGAAGGAMSGDPLLTGISAVGLPAAGYALKQLENYLAKSEMKGLDEAVRSRSPLAHTNPGQIPVATGGREALLKALLAYYQQNPNSL